ncbi:MAG: hypothetical protein BGO01_19580 [Armatimonadetes bacterium 55-13]|nr:rod shape-determining protein MreD [Armatimonadota bacterium]OJU64315.1 MAG: hypothetical protein BGO01_19580 [Armatimonadetes bacterium 55-13]
MIDIRFYTICGLLIWLGAALQQAVAHRLGILGFSPDFLLTFVACLCLYASRVGGAVIGFFAGLAAGATIGANLTQYVFSRSLTGFLDAWSRNFGFDANFVVAAVNAALVTIIAQMILMFFAPPSGITAFVGATIGSAMYNGVLAVPVYALLRRILGPQGA